MPEPILTPAQQALMGFLDRLASTDRVSPDLIAEGNNLLDTAVEEHRQVSDTIHTVGKALSQAQREAHHDE
jgi:predicted aldo/keto reductase-like oxidoreductase